MVIASGFPHTREPLSHDDNHDALSLQHKLTAEHLKTRSSAEHWNESVNGYKKFTGEPA